MGGADGAGGGDAGFGGLEGRGVVEGGGNGLVEGGRAGGHHSWEDLDDLLLDSYAMLRERSNVVLCVGGGIGTPERAADYLTGSWANAHGYPAMPVRINKPVRSLWLKPNVTY